MTQPQAEFLDLYKAGLKTAADLVKVSLQSAEKLQNQQLGVIRQALDQQAKSISELGQARTIDDLLALQTKFAGAQVERAVGYWTEISQTQMALARDWLSETVQVTSSVVRPVQRQEQHRKSA